MPPEYSAEERATLLSLARRAIESSDFSVVPEDFSSHLLEPRGAFTTLHLHGALRGCIGFIEPRHPLWQTVVSTARAAAFEDPRFPSVTPVELQAIKIELSVMSPIRPIAPEDVEVGIHGLIVSQHGRRGLLLPQVAPEWGWDRETFLSQTCAKAGLPPDAWRKGATIEAFTA